MSFDKMLRDVIRDEMERMVSPLKMDLDAQGAVLARLAAAMGAPLKRGPGRPPKLLLTAGRRRGGGASRGSDTEAGRLCAVEGCGRPARSKGYCAAHYQKYRMLEKTGRLPSDWVEYAPEGSVKNITLPRGRAGAKALAEAKKKSKG